MKFCSEYDCTRICSIIFDVACQKDGVVFHMMAVLSFNIYSVGVFSKLQRHLIHWNWSTQSCYKWNTDLIEICMFSLFFAAYCQLFFEEKKSAIKFSPFDMLHYIFWDSRGQFCRARLNVRVGFHPCYASCNKTLY